MPNFANPKLQATYDPRWFIWTIVFLVVVGISLTAYIFMVGNADSQDAQYIVVKNSTARLPK